tara:strand:- start:1763 stop:2281 length:519 start_codon:yes stop_codon:yes gene_type:complete
MALTKLNNAAISSVTNAGLPALDHTNMINGSVIQLVHTGGVAQTQNTTQSWTNTAHTLDITPTSSSSKIYFAVSGHVRISGSGSPIRGGIRLARIIGSTQTLVWNSASNVETMQVRNADNEHDTPIYLGGVDSPNTTGVVTYTVQSLIWNGSFINHYGSTSGGGITLIEFKA